MGRRSVNTGSTNGVTGKAVKNQGPVKRRNIHKMINKMLLMV